MRFRCAEVKDDVPEARKILVDAINDNCNEFFREAASIGMHEQRRWRERPPPRGRAPSALRL